MKNMERIAQRGLVSDLEDLRSSCGHRSPAEELLAEIMEKTRSPHGQRMARFDRVVLNV
jgi:hypothetical protein